MAKSELEKQLEKQMRQQKQLEDRKRRDEQKRIRDEARSAKEEAVRQRATTIVSGRELVAGMRIMDKTSEDMLNCLLKCERKQNNQISFEYDIFPEYVQMSILLELEKLTQYGMIGGVMKWMSGGMLDLLPTAITYFEDKEKAIAIWEQQREQKMQSIVNYGNIIYGNVSGSTISVDNSIHQIEKAIEENGGDDKEELREILEEVKELVDNMQTSRSIPKQKKLFERLSKHLEMHGWFYGSVVQLLGTAALSLLGA